MSDRSATEDISALEGQLSLLGWNDRGAWLSRAIRSGGHLAQGASPRHLAKLIELLPWGGRRAIIELFVQVHPDNARTWSSSQASILVETLAWGERPGMVKTLLLACPRLSTGASLSSMLELLTWNDRGPMLVFMMDRCPPAAVTTALVHTLPYEARPAILERLLQRDRKAARDPPPSKPAAKQSETHNKVADAKSSHANVPIAKKQPIQVKAAIAGGAAESDIGGGGGGGGIIVIGASPPQTGVATIFASGGSTKVIEMNGRASAACAPRQGAASSNSALSTSPICCQAICEDAINVTNCGKCSVGAADAERKSKAVSDDKPKLLGSVLVSDATNVAADQCTICLENRRNVAAIPCGHVSMCTRCHPAYKDDVCPLCRRHVENWLAVS